MSLEELWMTTDTVALCLLNSCRTNRGRQRESDSATVSETETESETEGQRDRGTEKAYVEPGVDLRDLRRRHPIPAPRQGTGGDRGEGGDTRGPATHAVLAAGSRAAVTAAFPLLFCDCCVLTLGTK